jgi:hypothetical protein
MKMIRILIGLLIIGCFTVLVFTQEKNLTEKGKIIANLKDENTIPQEVARIKEIRNTQIAALTYIINDFQQGLLEDRASLRSVPAENAIKLLGDIRATEAVDSLINFACFMIDEETSRMVTGADWSFTVMAFDSALQDSLVKFGKPTTDSLVKLLKEECVRTHFTAGLTEEGKKSFKQHDNSNLVKRKFFRKILYLIEGDCAIHRLEKALKEETDKQKKENLSEAITKFREEIKAGAYNK